MEPRFNRERQLHILERHPYMRSHLEKIRETVAQPDAITPSTSDANVSLYYRKYDLEGLGTKYLCVVVKQENGGSFVLTAYPTKTIR